MCYAKAIIACHSRCRLTMYVVQRAMIASQARRHSTLCASKIYDCMSCPTSSELVCCTMKIIAFHARPHPTMCAAKGPCGHATPYVVQLCVQYKGDENIICRHHLIMYAFQNDDWMPCPTLSDRVCGTREMMECNARRSLIASISQW